MDNSEDQFNSLLAELMLRTNRALSMGEDPPPMALAMNAAGKSQLFVGVADSEEQLATILVQFTNALSSLAQKEEIVASCVAHFRKDEGCVIVELENNENDCAHVVIPVLPSPARQLVMQEMVVGDGSVKIFPLGNS